MSEKTPLLTEGSHAVLQAPTPEAIRTIARRLKRANNPAMQLVNLIGGSADHLLDRLPAQARGKLDSVTLSALEMALDGAVRTRRSGVKGSAWLSRAVASGLGALGGVAGLPSTLAELPVSTTVLLHAIQSVAEEYGFDPERDDVRKASLQVFAAAGPFEDDDSADLSFLMARTTLTGASVHALIGKVAPKLAVVLGQKLAAQTVPVLGAAAGAATNYAFVSYYQEMAHVTFGMMRLAEDSDCTYAELKAMLAEELKRL